MRHLFIGIVSLCCLLVAEINAKPALPSCGTKAADVFFVLVASSSIWEPNFEKQLTFVNSIIDIFDIGPNDDQTQVGLLTFSDFAWEQFNLKAYTDKTSLQKAVKSIPYKTGGTNTSDALRITRMKMFSEGLSSREDIVKIAVVITDGMSEDTKATYREAIALKASGIQVFAVGVGFGIDETELEVIGSSPSDEFVFMVDDYEALDSIRNQLAIRTCEVTQMTTTMGTHLTTPSATTTTTTAVSSRSTLEISTSPSSSPTISAAIITETDAPKSTIDSRVAGDQPPEDRADKICQGKPAEVFFLLDSSSSILLPDFNKQLGFVQTVVDLFDFGPSKTRVGLSTFSDKVSPIFNLDSYNTKSAVASAILDIPYLGGGTETGDALRDMRTRGMAPEVVRREVAHIAIILTDGQSRDPDFTIEQARLAKQQGIYVFAIGIGENVDIQELVDIASYPDKRFVFHVDSYDALASIKSVLAIRACEVPSDEPKVAGSCPETPTDVMFLYDSANIGLEKSAAVVSLIDRVTSSLPMSTTEFQFGVLASTCATETAHIPSLSGRSDIVIQAYQEEPRDFASLFHDLRKDSFSSREGGREGARQLAVVFLDGTLQNHDEVYAQAQTTKASGIEIYVIGAGNDVNMRDVRALVSGPLATHYIHLPNFEQVSSQYHRIDELLCQGTTFTINSIVY